MIIPLSYRTGQKVPRSHAQEYRRKIGVVVVSPALRQPIMATAKCSPISLDDDLFRNYSRCVQITSKNSQK